MSPAVTLASSQSTAPDGSAVVPVATAPGATTTAFWADVDRRLQVLEQIVLPKQAKPVRQSA